MIELNEKQLEAVKSISQPTLVVAVPGSGKTRVIVEKYIYLSSIGYSFNKIVAITFTNKAAKEMSDRIRSRIEDFIDHPYISTIHSFALRLMIENKTLFNFKKGSTVIDDEDSKSIISEVLEKNNISLLSNEIISFITEVKENFLYDIILYCYKNSHHLLLDKEDINENYLKVLLKKYKRIEKLRKKLEVFSLYQKYLYENCLYDFDDLIIYPLLTIILDQTVKKAITSYFDYILVDEFQDINEQQNRFIMEISNGANITAVGDEDQAIYGFRGASIKPILNFESNFKKSKIIYMDLNYRSKTKIIEAANTVIIKNKKRRDKLVKPVNLSEGSFELNKYGSEEVMVFFLVQKIIELINKGVPLSEIAVLVRTAWLQIKIQNELVKRKVPFNLLRGSNFFEKKEIKYPIYYLFFMLNQDNEFYFNKISQYPKKGIGKVTYNKILNEKKDTGKNFIDILLTSDIEKLRNFGIFLTNLFNTQGLAEFFEKLIKEGGFLIDWLEEDEKIRIERIENINILINLAKEFEEENRNNEDKNENIFQNFITWIMQYYIEDKNNDAVVLGTLHSAKGLEFEAVFLPYVTQTILPYERQGIEADEEEERRLFYVGMTRAKSYLYIMHSEQIYARGSNLNWSKLILPVLESNNFTLSDESMNSTFNIGEYIEADGYGYGKIIEIKKLRNGKFAYLVENQDGVMQFVEGLHILKKKEFDY